jgi:CDI immunity proteins
MVSPGVDESRIRDLISEFSAAVERESPREIAVFMCADEAEPFLDNTSVPHDHVAERVETSTVRVIDVRVFGDTAFARFARETDEVRSLYFRREHGRWTVCADAEDDLSLEQLEGNAWPAAPSDATRLVRAAHELRRKPIGSLGVEGLRFLLLQNEGLDVLLPRTMILLQSEPLLEGDLYPGDLLAAALQVDHDYWRKDPVSLTRMRIVVDAIRDLGDLTEHDAPHDEIWNLISAFCTDLASRPPENTP